MFWLNNFFFPFFSFFLLWISHVLVWRSSEDIIGATCALQILNLWEKKRNGYHHGYHQLPTGNSLSAHPRSCIRTNGKYMIIVIISNRPDIVERIHLEVIQFIFFFFVFFIRSGSIPIIVCWCGCVFVCKLRDCYTRFDPVCHLNSNEWMPLGKWRWITRTNANIIITRLLKIVSFQLLTFSLLNWENMKWIFMKAKNSF